MLPPYLKEELNLLSYKSSSWRGDLLNMSTLLIGNFFYMVHNWSSLSLFLRSLLLTSISIFFISLLTRLVSWITDFSKFSKSFNFSCDSFEKLRYVSFRNSCASFLYSLSYSYLLLRCSTLLTSKLKAFWIPTRL